MRIAWINSEKKKGKKEKKKKQGKTKIMRTHTRAHTHTRTQGPHLQDAIERPEAAEPPVRVAQAEGHVDDRRRGQAAWACSTPQRRRAGCRGTAHAVQWTIPVIASHWVRARTRCHTKFLGKAAAHARTLPPQAQQSASPSAASPKRGGQRGNGPGACPTAPPWAPKPSTQLCRQASGLTLNPEQRDRESALAGWRRGDVRVLTQTGRHGQAQV